MPQLRKNFRFMVDLTGEKITPLASVKAYLGEEFIRIHNISMGGMALIFEREKELKVGENLDISVSIRERAFPVRIEIKSQMGLRYSCCFVEPNPAFENALKDFLFPKVIGESFKKSEDLSGDPDAIQLVDGAKNYETYVGDQKSAAFVWMDERRNLLKLLFLVRGRALEWVRNEKVRSGVLVDSQTGEIEWSEEFDALSHQFFADVLLSWLNVSQGPFFVKSLLENSLTLDDELSRFPLLN
jgi:hypothetical protein